MAPLFKDILRTISNIQVPLPSEITYPFFDASNLFNITSTPTSAAYGPSPDPTHIRTCPTSFREVLPNPPPLGLWIFLLYLCFLAHFIRRYNVRRNMEAHGLGVEKRRWRNAEEVTGQDSSLGREVDGKEREKNVY
ncbi:hypothetical protein VTL71DRAFT_717 [Oculimacula yallundae]|uniref:ATP synthase F0 subunit 8 n=1 Tax=Oculimacula yallundae TaxID=86028 RepID=A0ABR4D0V3_9HELO